MSASSSAPHHQQYACGSSNIQVTSSDPLSSSQSSPRLSSPAVVIASSSEFSTWPMPDTIASHTDVPAQTCSSSAMSTL